MAEAIFVQQTLKTASSDEELSFRQTPGSLFHAVSSLAGPDVVLFDLSNRSETCGLHLAIFLLSVHTMTSR